MFGLSKRDITPSSEDVPKNIFSLAREIWDRKKEEIKEEK